MTSPLAVEGNDLLRVGLFSDAAKSFERSLTDHPDDLDCLLGLARAQVSLVDLQAATTTLQRLKSIDPDNREAQSHAARLRFETGDQEAMREIEDLAEAPGAGFPERFNLATAYALRESWDEAEAALVDALEAQPNNPYGHCELGRISLQRQEYENAIRSFDKASQLAPTEWRPLWLKARAHAAKGEISSAVRTLEDALTKAPREPVLFEDLANCCLVAGSNATALQAAERFHALASHNPEAVRLHAATALANAQPDDAHAVLREGVEQFPNAWPLRQLLAHVLRLRKDDEGALSVMEDAVRQWPSEPGPVNELALFYLDRNEPARAAVILLPALESFPEELATHLSLALALRRSDPARAMEHARRAAESTDPSIADQGRQLVAALGT